MALPPIVVATIQSSVIAGIANVLAQLLAARRDNVPFVLDLVPVFQFVLFSVVSTPPNFKWQEFLEVSFPAYHIAPTREAIASAAAGDDKELDKEAREGRLVEPALNKRNTLIKTVLDQTVGAAGNTILFSLFMHALKAAMAHFHSPHSAYQPSAVATVAAILSGKAVRYGNVDWAVVWAKSAAEFWGILQASWYFWPFVSLVNFAVLKTVAARNLSGSLAGLAWGIYMSLFVA